MNVHVLTADQVRAIYAYLIEKSWLGPEHFQCHQDAWNAIEKILEVDAVEDNGHGG